MSTSFTNEDTIFPKAAPMTIPTAISTTLPRMANSLNSFNMGILPVKVKSYSVDVEKESRGFIHFPHSSFCFNTFPKSARGIGLSAFPFLSQHFCSPSNIKDGKFEASSNEEVAEWPNSIRRFVFSATREFLRFSTPGQGDRLYRQRKT